MLRQPSDRPPAVTELCVWLNANEQIGASFPAADEKQSHHKDTNHYHVV